MPTPPSTDPIFIAPVTNPFGISSAETLLKPVFADIDGDGDLDLFIGNGADTVFYRNTGSAKLAVFALEGQGNFGLGNVGSRASPGLVDVDGDGDLDAFISNNLGATQFFRNTGSSAVPAFAPEVGTFGISNVGFSAVLAFADIDSDGDQDAFIGNSSGITRFFRNTGTASAPAFELQVGNFGLPSVGFSAAPTFADIDGDGDLDAFVGEFFGSTQFFRNTGTATSPSFAAASSNFGITSVTSHAGPTLADIDADGDLDAFVGYAGGIQFFQNSAAGVAVTQSGGRTAVTEVGTTDSYTVVLNRAPTANVTITLDNTNKQINLSASSLTFTTVNWNVPQTVTVTAVNDTVGEGSHTGAVRHGVTSADAAYDNMVVKPLTVTIGDYDLPAHDPIFAVAVPVAFGLTGGGNSSNPTFADIDSDGDLDAFVGKANGNPQFYRNTGTALAPSFVHEQNNFGIEGSGVTSPCLVDIDGDGDQDVFVGRANGNTLFFLNTGSASAPNFSVQPGNFGIGNVEFFANPAFADIDGDGDQDAFVGQSTGATIFFRNTGGISAPRFSAEPGGFSLPSVNGSANPSFADIEGDGDLDAFIGDLQGITHFYRNTGSPSVPAFAAESSNFGITDAGFVASPRLVDIDGDGDLDAFVGGVNGSSQFFLNTAVVDAPGVTFGNPGTVVEGGASGSYTVVLNRAPSANVTITLGSSTPQLSTDATILSFTPSNWNVAQTVYVRAVDDPVGEGAHAGAIRHTATSADLAFNGLTPRPVAVQIKDNDLPLQNAAFGTPVIGAFGLVNVGGGSATPVFADIDADGDMDAFVGVSDGSTVFLRNTGSASAPAFTLEASNNFGLTGPGFDDYAAPALVDIDADGDLDAFVGNFSEQVRFFRNSGSASAPAFTREAGPLDLVAAGGGSTRPTFADIDGDGDLDAFVGFYGGSGFQFFRNTGNATAPIFSAESGALGVANIQRFPSPQFVDLDGDGDQDLVSGADSEAERRIFVNTGTATAPSFVLTGASFGLSSIGQYTRPSFVDLDADGDLDAVAGNSSGALAFYQNSAPGVQIRQSDGRTAITEGGATDTYTVQLRTAPAANVTITLDTTNQQVGASVGTLTFTPQNWNVAQQVTVTAFDDRVGEGLHYGAIRHTVASADSSYNGVPLTPLQVRVSDNDLPAAPPAFAAGDVNPFGIVSQAAHAAPVLADLDADGDLDALVAYTDGLARMFRNNGSPNAPGYSVVAGNLGLVDVGDEASVALADIDGDGDLDAFMGSLQGTTRYFRNIGNAGNPSFSEVLDALGVGDVGTSSRPAFADIDGDGDSDLFVGNSVGEVWFHRNVGSTGQPQFQAATLAASNFGIGQVGAMASPSFADLDGDGDLDAIVGDQDGDARVFINTGTAQTPNFVFIANGQLGLGDVGYAASPTFADIDGDGDLDALVGNLVGGTRLFLGVGTLALAPLPEIVLLDSPRDDNFATTQLRLNAVGADGAPVGYGIQGGTANGGSVSLSTALGTLTVASATGAASFAPIDAAIEALGASATLQFTLTASTANLTSTTVLTIAIRQSGTTETPGNDVLGGTERDDLLDGLAGNDSILGMLGNDNIAGGDGFDTLLGNAGNDTLRGGINGDSLLGGDGDDLLSGGKGIDSLDGGAGNDTLIGGLGTDLLNGGSDIDTADYSASTDGVTVSLLLTTAQQVSLASGLDTLLQIENLIGSAFPDLLTGSTGNNTLVGGLGNDTLNGDQGFDSLDGGDGNDSLAGGQNGDTLLGGIGNDFLGGGQGIDSLVGGEGDDTLVGGLGTDRLVGGSGADRYVFRHALDGAFNIDTFADLEPGVDVVELSASIFGALAGSLGQKLGTGAHLTYNNVSGVLAYDPDGAGIAAPIPFAVVGVGTHPATLGNDFLIVA